MDSIIWYLVWPSHLGIINILNILNIKLLHRAHLDKSHSFIFLKDDCYTEGSFFYADDLSVYFLSFVWLYQLHNAASKPMQSPYKFGKFFVGLSIVLAIVITTIIDLVTIYYSESPFSRVSLCIRIYCLDIVC